MVVRSSRVWWSRGEGRVSANSVAAVVVAVLVVISATTSRI
jgi:hypothetical protein